ncbi:cation-transporting ATPase [Aureococcus anophagefferens]|nr:cation-transporting ATPase [Aureococcus anophagefferens]
MPSADDDAAHVLRIGGMTCGHCVGAVTSALEGVAGVARADVDLERGLATVAAAPGASLALADLVDAVEASGFDASDAAGGGGAATTQTLAVEGMSCGQCERSARRRGRRRPLRSLGVDDISVNCATDAATFRALGASPALVTRAVAAVKQAGYASSPDTARVEAEGEKAATTAASATTRAFADDDGVDVAGEERARKLARVAEVRAFRRRRRVRAAAPCSDGGAPRHHGSHADDADCVSGHHFFETSSVLIAFVLLGKFMEAKAKGVRGAPGAAEPPAEDGDGVAHHG